MQSKLKLEHLSAYLPYGLKCNWNNENYEMISLRSNERCQLADNYTDDVYGVKLIHIKPILRPLSEFESDHIEQIKDYLGIGQWCDYYDQYFDAWFDDPCSVDKLVLQAPYEIMQYFLENHYDVFNLLQNGLAISIHDIKQ